MRLWIEDKNAGTEGRSSTYTESKVSKNQKRGAFLEKKDVWNRKIVEKNVFDFSVWERDCIGIVLLCDKARLWDEEENAGTEGRSSTYTESKVCKNQKRGAFLEKN